ncbi:MAG: MFS transporter, partial [Trebonia sp.]
MSVISEAAGPYRRLLGEPALRELAVADVCARLPQGMVAITLLLVAATHDSMTTAGLVVAGYTLGQAVTGPLRGRLADRYGLARVCAFCGCGYAVALLGLLAGSLAGSPAWLLVAAAAAAGLIVPPLSPGMRSLWSAQAPRAAADRVRPGRGRVRPRLPHRARRGQRTGGRRRPGSGRRPAAGADRRGDRHDRPAFPASRHGRRER